MIFEPGLIPEYWLSKKSVSWAPLGCHPLQDGERILSHQMMRYFEEIPTSSSRAAQVDGASYMTILGKIILPLSKPALATLGLFYGVFH